MRRHRRIERAQDARTHLGREPPVQHHGTVVVVPEGETTILVLDIGPLGLFGPLGPAMEDVAARVETAAARTSSSMVEKSSAGRMCTVAMEQENPLIN